MKYYLSIILCFFLKTCSLAQSSGLLIKVVQDTVFLSGNEIAFEIDFENQKNENITLFFAKDLCPKPSSEESIHSYGFMPISVNGEADIFCDGILRRRKLVNPTDRKMEKDFQRIHRESLRGERQKNNGQLFCNKQKIVLKPGLNFRKYKLKINSNELPAGVYKIQFKYQYSRSSFVKCECVQCYPKIASGEVFFEGTLITEPIVIVVR